jgi:hypothetical protein
MPESCQGYFKFVLRFNLFLTALCTRISYHLTVLKCKLVSVLNYEAMEACVRIGVELHIFLNSVLDGGAISLCMFMEPAVFREPDCGASSEPV